MLPHTLRLAARATRPALPTSTFLSTQSASRGTRRARAIHSHVSAPPTHRLRVLGIYSRSAAPSHMTASTHVRHMPRWVARQMSTAEPKPDPNAEGADPKKNVPMITQVARGEWCTAWHGRRLLLHSTQPTQHVRGFFSL